MKRSWPLIVAPRRFHEGTHASAPSYADFNSTTFQLFPRLGENPKARDDCKRRKFSARVAEEKSSPVFTCARSLHAVERNALLFVPAELHRGEPPSEPPSAGPPLFPLGERRQFCVIKHCIIAFPRGPRNSDNCGNGIKKYTVLKYVLYSSCSGSMRDARPGEG